MSGSISLTQTAIFTATVAALHTFGMVDGAGAAVSIVRGQINRVPEPNGKDFLVLWPISRDRLAMNADSWIDTTFVGSIAANILTVSGVSVGSIVVGATLYASGITPGTRILAKLLPSETYSVTPTANHGPGTIYAGTTTALQETEVTIQADVHGPNSADNAARLATLFRDQFGVSAFIDQGVALAPLYTSDPKQIPFENGEQQTEERWVVDLCMQANVGITTTQQFADTLTITTTPVEVLA